MNNQYHTDNNLGSPYPNHSRVHQVCRIQFFLFRLLLFRVLPIFREYRDRQNRQYFFLPKVLELRHMLLLHFSDPKFVADQVHTRPKNNIIPYSVHNINIYLHLTQAQSV